MSKMAGMTLDARRAYELERQLAEDRFTVYCPKFDIWGGPFTLVETAQSLANNAKWSACFEEHTIELIEVTNDDSPAAG
jgi:hypothetical protein